MPYGTEFARGVVGNVNPRPRGTASLERALKLQISHEFDFWTSPFHIKDPACYLSL